MKIFCIVGTRPEFIKMFPVYWTLKQKDIEVKWINTSQHKELLGDLEEFFQVKADFNFNIKDSGNPNSRLGELGSELLKEATELFLREKPDLVYVQGDTLTAQYCALAAFYQRIKVAHIEAGLRTSDVHNPFPEELSRRTISQIADLNFSPELKAQENLEMEKQLFQKKSYNFYTGNTVIDCLSYSMDKIAKEDFNWQSFNYIDCAFEEKKFDLDKYLNEKKQYILITAHRRENLFKNAQLNSQSNNISNLIASLKRLLENKFAEGFDFVVMIHKNPELRESFIDFYNYCKEKNITRVKFFEPMTYPAFLKLMANSYFIVTDSGGIQEEAPYLKKPVLIFREVTERLAGLELGLSKLIGSKESSIHGEILELISSEKSYKAMVETGLQPYGDGLAASRIVDASLLYLTKS